MDGGCARASAQRLDREDVITSFKDVTEDVVTVPVAAKGNRRRWPEESRIAERLRPAGSTASLGGARVAVVRSNNVRVPVTPSDDTSVRVASGWGAPPPAGASPVARVGGAEDGGAAGRQDPRQETARRAEPAES